MVLPAYERSHPRIGWHKISDLFGRARA
jgi:hypothetical protein